MLRRVPIAVAMTGALLPACARDSRGIHAADSSPPRSPSPVSTESFPLCTLIGPGTHSPGVFGTDLGFTAKDPHDPSRLAILFGDTWARSGGTCQYPLLGRDDLEGWLPSERPAGLKAGVPGAESAGACRSLGYARSDPGNPTSWPPIRLLDGGSVMDTGALHTPVAAFTDGQRLFTIYSRNDAAYCKRSGECPDGMTCSSDPGYRGRKLGVCAHTSAGSDDAVPTFCRDVADCTSGLQCKNADRGVCLSTSAFEMQSPRGFVSPSWYRDDPRLGIAHTMYVAGRTSPGPATDYSVLNRFVTNRFVNVAARTIANFDELHPEKNDYRPGTHTLLLWGRSTFFGMGGVQNLPFLLHLPLADHGVERFRPRYFAGYDRRGEPAWSSRESDAEPVYGTDARLSPSGEIEWLEPEFDYDNQMTVSFIPAIARLVMLYGGDVPAFMVRDPRTGATPDPTFLQRSPGAIHLRTAPHPWGRRRVDPLLNEGFSSPVPVLTRKAAAHYLACGDGGEQVMPGCLKKGELSPRDGTAAPVTARMTVTCALGDLAMAAQQEMSGNPIGRFYAPNVIDEWTEDVTAHTSGLAADEREVELYWNVSTWNPYQVILVKTRLRGRAPP